MRNPTGVVLATLCLTACRPEPPPTEPAGLGARNLEPVGSSVGPTAGAHTWLVPFALKGPGRPAHGAQTVATAYPAPSTTVTVPDYPGMASPVAQGDACSGLVTAHDGDLWLNGSPIFLLGVNAHYLMDEELPEGEADAVLSEIASLGVDTVRVWFFHNEDPERFERLLDQAAAHNLKLVVTLADNVFHGKDWFFGEEDEEDYRPHVARTVGRFSDRKEIAAWELINEPNCGDGGYDDDCLKTIRDWLVMAARIVRGLDPCRPISTGMIGAGNFDADKDSYRRIQSKSELDLASIHRATDQDWDSSADRADGDPVFFGEVYDRAYDGDCQPLGPSALSERAERVKDDIQSALDDGIDGYLLWDYAPGAIRRINGDTKYYCSEFGYERDDPLWGKLRNAGLLSVPAPAQ